MIKLPRRIVKLLIGAVAIMVFYGLMSACHARYQDVSLPTRPEPSTAILLMAVQRGALTVSILLMLIAVQVGLKFISRTPSELDRIGSEINLYAVGILLSLFILAMNSKEPVLFGIDKASNSLFLSVALLVSFFSYILNLRLSQRIRDLGQGEFKAGIETWEQLHRVLEEPEGRRLMTVSFAIAFFPTSLLLLALAP